MPDSSSQLRDALLLRPIVPIDIPATSADKQLFTRPCLLIGWSFRETTGGAVASVELFGAQGTQGPRVGEQAVASAGSGSQTISNEGLLCEGGLNLHMVSGSVAGTVWIRGGGISV